MDNEELPAASAEPVAPTSLTEDQFVAKLNEMDARAPEPAAAEEVTEAAPAEVEAEAPAEELPKTEEEDLVDVHGNAWTRLRDGTRVRVGDLKRSLEQVREYEAKQSEFDAKRREFEENSAKAVQEYRSFGQKLAVAKQVVEENIPPDPSEAFSKGEIDVITYNEINAKRAVGIAKWQQIIAAQQQAIQQEQLRQEAEGKEYVAREAKALGEKVPELRTTEGLRTFFNEASAFVSKAYGISDDEVRSIQDHRHLLLVKDAMAYRKLTAEKEAALAKVKTAPPVSAPPPQANQRRVSSSEAKNAQIHERMQAARSSGKGLPDHEVLAILNAMD
jgi:hypothetical protein